jgi:hypothetical protein
MVLNMKKNVMQFQRMYDKYETGVVLGGNYLVLNASTAIHYP